MDTDNTTYETEEVLKETMECEYPSHVIIGHVQYPITYTDEYLVDEDESEMLYGLCTYGEDIKMSTKGINEHFKSTLLHEIIHAVDYHAGIELEERQVQALGNNLYMVFKQNVYLRKFLFDY